jgi:hypothetical protein
MKFVAAKLHAFYLSRKGQKHIFFNEKVCNELFQHVDYQLCCFAKVCIAHFEHIKDDF